MTTLANAIGTTDTLLPLDGALDVGSYPAPFVIDSEAILVTGGDGSSLVSTLRAQNGTAAATHSAGSSLTAGWYTSGDGLPTGWTQDPDTGTVDTGGQDFMAANVNAVSIGSVGGALAISLASNNIDLAGASSDPSAYLGLDDGVLWFDAGHDNGVAIQGGAVAFSTDAAVKFGAGLDAQEYDIINFNQLVPHTKPQVPAVATAQDIVDALITLGLITQAAP